MTWQPIHTAPYGLPIRSEATHWMPLPPPLEPSE